MHTPTTNNTQPRQCNNYQNFNLDIPKYCRFSAYKPGKDEVDQFIATMKPSEDSKSESSEYEDYWDSYEVLYQLLCLKGRSNGTTAIAVDTSKEFCVTDETK